MKNLIIIFAFIFTVSFTANTENNKKSSITDNTKTEKKGNKKNDNERLYPLRDAAKVKSIAKKIKETSSEFILLRAYKVDNTKYIVHATKWNSGGQYFEVVVANNSELNILSSKKISRDFFRSTANKSK